MRSKNFNFISEDQLKGSPQDSVVYKVNLRKVVTKDEDGRPERVSWQLYFPKEVIDIFDLKGKMLKLYADGDRKALAWKEIEQIDGLTGVRQVTPVTQGYWTVSVNTLLSGAGIEPREARIGIPVKTYKTVELGQERSYRYIEL